MGNQTINILLMRLCSLVIYAAMLLLLILNIAALHVGAWQLYMGSLFLMAVCNAASITVVNILFRVLLSSPPPVRVYCLTPDYPVY